MRDRALDALLEPLVAPGADAESVTDEVLSRLPWDERERLLREMVLVRVKRSLAAHIPRPPLPEETPVEPVPYIPRAPLAHRAAPAPAPPPSAKVMGIRNWWQEFLSEQVVLSGRAKPLGDCTAADMDVLARQRMAAAQKQAKQAHGLAALAVQMREHGARTVKDLPQHRAQRALAK